MEKSLAIILSDKEKKIIELIRSLEYGEIKIEIVDNQPVAVEEIRKSTKL